MLVFPKFVQPTNGEVNANIYMTMIPIAQQVNGSRSRPYWTLLPNGALVFYKRVFVILNIITFIASSYIKPCHNYIFL